MKHQITNIRWAGTRWLADVEYWQGCRCGSEIKQVTINQEKKPTKTEIVGAFKLQLGD